MAQSPRTERSPDERVPEDATGDIRIMVGDEVVQAYDASNLGDDQRRDIASRIVRYADSQTLGLKRRR